MTQKFFVNWHNESLKQWKSLYIMATWEIVVTRSLFHYPKKTNFRQNKWLGSTKVIFRIKERRIIIVQDAAKKPPQTACSTSSKSRYFWDQRLRSCQYENNINAISAQKLDTQANQELLVGFAPQEISNYFNSITTNQKTSKTIIAFKNQFIQSFFYCTITIL